MKNKLQILIAMLLCTLWITGLNAQTVYIEDYTCSSSVETYTPLGSTATVLSPTTEDDGYATVSLPFAFTFGSTPMTAGSSIYMSVNGFITLNTSYSSTTPSYSGSYNVISPLGHDLHLRSSGQLKSEVSGTAPDRVLTLQWSNVETYTAGNIYNFQVKLYEGSSNIQFCYGNSTVTASKSVYCFLREYTQDDYVIAMNNWNTPVFVTSGSTFSKNLDASQYPSNGRTYTFVRPTPTCNKPTSLTLGSVTSSSATISWTAGGSETSWEVICAEMSADISTLTPTVVSTPSYTAQGLTKDHQYILYVRAQCPNGVETSAWRSMIFRTACGSGIQSLPYTEDFSSYGGTGSYTYFPSCWNRSSTAGNYPYISSTGGNSLYLYTSSGNYTYATAPALAPAISPNTVAMRFKMYAGSQNYMLKVGVMTDSSDINTFVPVATLTTSATSTWEEKDVYFNTYAGTGQFIAFLSDARTLASTNIIYIDDVSITPLPACARPANLRSINATDNSITLQWASAGTESQWNIKYYETGDTTTMVTTTANTNPFIVTGLTSNTSYTFFAQANCGSETSEWSVPYITPTLYVAPATLPFVCDFETSTEAANWGFENDTCANQWVVGDAVNNTPNGSSALYVSNDNGVSNSYTFTAPATVYAVRDIYLDNSYDYYTVTYDYKCMGQGTTDYLRLYLGMTAISMVHGNAMGTVSTIPGAAQLNIDGNAYQSSQANWRHVNLLLDKDTWGNRVLRLYFMWRNDASTGENPPAAIDNLVVKGYNCPMVADITLDANTLTANSATIMWTDSLNTGNYEVVLVPKGGNPDNETPVTVSGTTYTFTGLNHSTEYTAYVRVLCGTGVSAWSELTFSTVCGQISTLPFTENFDGLPTGSSAPLPNCWTRTNNYSTYPYFSTSYHASGNASLYFYGTTTYYSYAVLPEIDTTVLPINTLMMNLKSLKTSTTSTYGRFDVGVMSDPSNVNTFTVVKSFYGTDMPQTSTWYNQEVLFNNFAGNGSYIAIRTPNEGTSYVYIDDVELTTIPTCLPPVDVTLSHITSDAVTVSWIPRNGETNWNVVVVPAGTAVTTGTPEPTTAFPYTVSNLLPSTAYDVYVQADCGGGDESPWSVAASFTTMCLPTSTLPYVENFEGIGTGTGAFPSCWTRISTYNATTPYVSSSLHSDGAAALYFYQPSGTNTTLAVTQALDLSTYNAGDLAFSFNISAYSGTSYARMDVGVMTDPTNMGTFTTLKSFYPSDFTATDTWQEHIIPLTQHYTTPVYFAFYMPQSTTSSYMFIDEVKVDYAPDCYSPSNFQVANVGATSAYLTWNNAYNVTDYVVEYSEQGQNNWTQVPVTGANSLFLTNLQQGLTYDVMLYANCSAGYSDTLTQSFSTQIFMDCVQPDPNPIAVTDSTNASTSYYVPIGNFYNYSYTQQIYTADEVSPTHTPVTITGIALNYGYSSSNTDKTNVRIYLAHRNSSSFSSTSDWTPIANATLVYEGSLVCTNGWNTFNFQNYFTYNGTDNLVVIVDDNSGGYDGSSYVFNTHTTSSYRAMYTQSDSDNPDPTNPPSGTRVYTLPDIKIFKCLQTVPMTCVPPTLVVTDVTPQDITVEWAAGGSETQWELSYKIGSNGSWTSLGTVTTSPYVLNNVTNDADYTFRLRSDCGNNEYSSYVTATTHVPCVSVVSLPLTENFDVTTGSGSGHMVGCWTRNTNYGSTLYPYTSSSQHYSGGYSVYFYGSSTAYSYIASPRLDDSIEMDSLLVTFQAYKTSANYFIEVGVMSDPYDISTFVPVGTFSPQNLNNFEFGSANTRGYAGNGHYIALRCPQWITNNIYVDDVVIDYIPDCYFVQDPHAVESSITATSARVTWTPGGDETDWEVVIGIAGSIINPATQTIEMVQNTPSYEFTNLLSNTLYEVFVRANCGSSYSDWMSCSFRTGCAAISSLPYVEDFESYPVNTSTSPSANNLPNCWDYRTTSPSTSSAYRFYPILYTSSSYAHNSQNSMCFYVYTTTSTYGAEIGILPEIDTTVLPINTLRLTFWQRAYNTGSSYHFPLEVGVMSDPTNPASFVQVDSFSMEGTGSTTYVQRVVDFTNYTGYGNRIAFKVAGPTASGYNYGYVDDIMLDYAPQCVAPTHLTVSSLSNTEATISWQPGDQEYEWTLTVYPVGSSIAAGTTVTVNSDTFYTISNLHPNTDYQVLLKSNCPSGSGYSANVEMTFTTLCDPITTLPYTENFDGVAGSTSTSVSVNNLPTCWFYHNTGTSTSYSGYPIIYNSAANAESGSNSMRFYVSTTTGTYSTQWAMLPALDVVQNPLNTLVLSFDARSTSTSYPLILEIGVMDNPSDLSTFTLVSTVTASGTAYTHHEVFFSNFTGTGSVIAIRAPQGGSSNYGNVDNIVVDLAPDCSPVNDLTVSQIMGTSALVTWTQGTMGVPVGYEVEYSEHNQNNWITVTTQDNFYLLSGLTQNTSYDVRVRTDCGTGYSTWVTTDFTTGCMVGGDVTIGTGSTTNSYLPFYGLYNYTYSQQIYDASELSMGAGEINSISFYCSSAPTSTTTGDIRIWMANTTKSTFSTDTDYISPSNLTEVCYVQGNRPITVGWNTFTLTQPFMYDGTSNLVVAYYEGYNTYSSSSFWAHSTSSHKSILHYSDTYSNVSYTTPASASGTQYFQNYRSDIRLGVPCDNTVTCAAPNVYVNNVTSTSADVNWVPGYMESAWNFEYKAQNDATWTSVPNAVSPVQLTGLLPATQYMVRIQSDCGGDVSNWTTQNFVTECAAVSIPYTQNFDNDGTGSNAHPGCWTVMNNYSTTQYPYISTSYHTSGTAGLYFFSSTSTYNLAVSPQLDLTNYSINDLQVSFQMRSSSSTTSALVVGMMTDPNDMTTFEPVDTVHNSAVSMFEYVTVPLNNYSGTGNYIGLKLINTLGTYSIYIDDFMVDTIPSCMRPSQLTATATQTEITLGWNDGNTGSEWIIEYGQGTFAHGTGTTVVANSNPYTITGLTPSTAYTFYVRSVCSATDSSMWSMAFRAPTECGLITTLPFTESFEGQGSGSSVQPICWTMSNTYSTSTRYPYISTSYHATGSCALYFYNSSTTYNLAVAPQVDVTAHPINTLQVSLKLYVTNVIPGLIVGVMTDPDNINTFVPIDTIFNATASTWYNYDIPLSHYTGTGSYIALKSYVSTSSYSLYMDDFVIDVMPSCPKPMNLAISNHTNTSATLTWTESGSAQNWEVEYGPANFTHGTGTVVQVQGTPTTTISGLNASTNYDFYVRAVCSFTDQSNWEGPVNLTPGAYIMSATGSATVTTCDLAIYDNGGPAGDYSNSCNSTLIINPATPGAVIVLTGTCSVEENYDYLYVYDGASTSGTLLATYNSNNQTVNCTSTTGPLTLYFTSDGSVPYPGFALTATCSGGSAIVDPTVTTQAADNISTTAATLHGTVTAGNETITAQGFEWKATTGGTYTAVNATGATMSYNLSGLTANTSYTFRAFATTASGTTYGNELTFTTLDQQQETCAAPTNVTASNITNTTADISWTQQGDVTNWDVNYRVAGVTSWYSATTSTNPYTLTGLSENTSYEVQVIAHCTNGVTSDPSAIITLTTVGINDYELNNVVVYPNPTTGMIQIQNSESRIENVEVYDAYGKMLNVVNVNDNATAIDLSGYAAGTYFVKIMTENGVVTKRVVKQ